MRVVRPPRVCPMAGAGRAVAGARAGQSGGASWRGADQRGVDIPAARLLVPPATVEVMRLTTPTTHCASL
jgi:hypothetical protein